MTTPTPENHPQAQPTLPLPPVPAPPATPAAAQPAPGHAAQAPQPATPQPAAPQPAYAAAPPAVPPTAPPTAPPTGQWQQAAPEPTDPHAAHERAERRRRLWIPVTSAAAAAALVAAVATVGITQGLDDREPTTQSADGSSSFSKLGQASTDAVPVAGSSSDDPDWTSVVAAVQGSVVAIETMTQGGGSLGSGVVVDDEGHVVTNNHVVAGARDDEVVVTLTDGRILTGKVVGLDPTTDLAVVELVDPPSDLEPAALGDSSQVRVGEPVMAVGNPLGLQSTVTTGIVSAVDRPVSTQNENASEATVTNAIQVDASVNPGNSGGPLFDAQGRVIGINSSIATTSQQSGSIGLGFAIPVNLVKNIAEQLIETGTAKHAFLGVGLDDGTATVDGVTRAGAVVKQVSEGSPAAEAGLQPDDVVVGIDGRAVGGAESLTAYVRSHAAGDQVTLTVARGGKALDVEVTLATKEDAAASPTPGDRGQQGQPGGGSQLPEDLQDMSPEELWQWLQENGSGQGR